MKDSMRFEDFSPESQKVISLVRAHANESKEERFVKTYIKYIADTSFVSAFTRIEMSLYMLGFIRGQNVSIEESNKISLFCCENKYWLR